MNTNWKKEIPMSTEDKFNIHEYRITQLESNFNNIQSKIERIEDICNRLDKKLNGIPDSGLQCPLHQMRMDSYEKRIETMEVTSDSLKKQVITWTAIFGIVAFLLSQIAIPYILNNYRVVDTDKQPRTEYPMTNFFSRDYKIN